MSHWHLLSHLLYLYILEGVPYGLQSRFLPLVLRTHGLSLTALGFYKLLHIPWLLKCFYAPVIETTFSKRGWLIWSMFGLFSITMVLSMYLNISANSNEDESKTFPLNRLFVCLFLYNFFAATQDIAVDGLALLFLPSSKLIIGNTVQVVGYKLGAIIGGGLLASLSAVLSLNQLFSAIACVYVVGILLCFCSSTLDETNAENMRETALDIVTKMSANNSTLCEAPKGFIGTLKQALFHSTGSRNLIVLLLLYKLGEQGAMNMLPLALLDRGASVAMIGFWCGTVGQMSSIVGSAAGYKCQNVGLSLIDMLYSLMTARFLLHLPLVMISVDILGNNHSTICFGLAVVCMNVTLLISGAITTVMFTLMMQCTRCESNAQTQATHYTILSTAELLGKLLFGILAASFTDLVGYLMANVFFLLLSSLPVCFVRVRFILLSFPLKCVVS